jgi:hypothetical protein
MRRPRKLFVPMLVRKMESHGYTVLSWRVEVKSGYVTPRNPWPNAALRSIVLHAQVHDRDTPQRIVAVNSVLERMGRGEIDNRYHVYSQQTRVTTLRGISATMAGENAFAECERLILGTCVRSWWDRIGPWCYERAEQKAAQVELFKEELAAAVWAPARVERWLEAGVELEAL